MALLLKQSPLISKLSLYDIVGTPGVAADLSHIETQPHVSGHVGPEQLDEALQGTDVVVIPAGVPRKPGECGVPSLCTLSCLSLLHHWVMVCNHKCVYRCDVL